MAEGIEKGFTRLSNEVFHKFAARLKGKSWVVLCYVVRFTEGYHRRKMRTSIRDMAHELGIARSSVQRSLVELEAERVVTVKRLSGWRVECGIEVEYLFASESAKPHGFHTVQRTFSMRNSLNSVPEGGSETLPPRQD